MRVDQTRGGSGPLQQYRLFFLDGGHIAAAPYQFEAESDAAAIRLAEAWREGRDIELWCGNRQVRLDG